MGIAGVVKGEKIYIDTNVFIYAMEGYPEFAASLTSLFTAIDEGVVKAVTSELTLAESLVKPLMDDNTVLENLYLEVFQTSMSLSVVPISRQILIESARLRAKSKTLRLPDAIHFATARMSGCQTFLTNDKQLKSVPDFDVAILSEEMF
jgi:predicted nucleic acid-binding protein